MMAEGESQVFDSARPTIIVDHELERMAEEATLALSLRGDVYQRGGKLVQIVEDIAGLIREAGAPMIEPIPLPTLHLILSSVADWRMWKKIDKELKLVPTTPPDKVVKGVFERKRFPPCIRELEAVIETPMIVADGRLIQTPGYDDQSGLLYLQPKDLQGYTVPEFPTDAEVLAARDLLLDLVCDFYFRSEAHRSAWIAGVLTYFARFAIPSQAPFFLVDANTPTTSTSRSGLRRSMERSPIRW